MMHSIRLESNNPLRGVWSVSKPDEHYSVQLIEPLSKSEGIFASADLWSIVVALQSLGLVEWARDKSFDSLWTYLRNSVHALGRKPLAKIHIASGIDEQALQVEIVGLSPDLVSRAEVSVRRALVDGRAEQEIHIRIGPQ
ncbi:hypothetical protein A2cp1_1106 [Anaeromyxobacter dehalogenans 2CP-1]|uniref:Uncharacterized protein n=2 Tax=Anaeromyxobacter dehalogenans TaxID=161493 RepID=B8JF96_ANAD2|nr:hypothetical protein A2cp1_1106 [Anaeromyxobacter dehalogenans 2CP-1]